MIRKICKNCISFEKPVLDCLQGKCHGFGKQIIDRFALEDACVSFLPTNEQYNCTAEGAK
jgi:hypothetical protein